MIVNPKKFQAKLILTQQSSQELFGVTIDNELKFDQHISRLCKLAVCQLNVLYR